MAVTALVLDLGGDEEEATAALLHDVVEDGGGRAALGQIEERWGARVAGAGRGAAPTRSSRRGASWTERKAA